MTFVEWELFGLLGCVSCANTPQSKKAETRNAKNQQLFSAGKNSSIV